MDYYSYSHIYIYIYTYPVEDGLFRLMHAKPRVLMAGEYTCVSLGEEDGCHTYLYIRRLNGDE